MINSFDLADRLDWIAKEEDLSEDLSLRTVETIKRAAAMLRELDDALNRASTRGWDERNEAIQKLGLMRIAVLEREVEQLRKKLVAHHSMGNLSDEVISATYRGSGTGKCPVCRDVEKP